MDWLKDFGSVIVGLLGISVTVVIGWVKSISSRVNSTATRVAILETNHSQVPILLQGIKDEISGMRADAKLDKKELYAHIDSFRKEVKDDLKGKQDK